MSRFVVVLLAVLLLVVLLAVLLERPLLRLMLGVARAAQRERAQRERIP